MEKMLLAKGDLSRDQTWVAHARTTQEIAKIIAELRMFDENHSELLQLVAYLHDIGKKVTESFKGKHKIQFETCVEEIEREFKEIEEEKAKIIAHLILRHHYTSTKDIEELMKIWVPPHISTDLLLRYLKAADRLASIDYLNMADVESLTKLVKPLKLFAYTISREGIIAGKIMDIVDAQLGKLGGWGIFYHNGSIFLFPEESNGAELKGFKGQLESSFQLLLSDIFSELIGVQGNPRQNTIAPVFELNSALFPFVWKKVLQMFDTKLNSKRKATRQGTHLWIQKVMSEIFSYFDGEYKMKVTRPSQQIYPTSIVLEPIGEQVEIKPLKKKKFEELNYHDFEVIGEAIKNYLEEQEKGFPEKFEAQLLKAKSLKKILEEIWNLLTFWGEIPQDVEEIAKLHYEKYIELAKRKAIGQEGIEEFCFICGEPTSFSFKSAIAQKIKIAKIFSNRRLALARNIENVKICSLCLAELKFLDGKLPSKIVDTIFLYLEKPATTKPPYVEVEQEFMSKLGYLEIGEPIYPEEWEYIDFTRRLFTKEKGFEFNYTVGTNHFYTIFALRPRDLSSRETLFLLMPFLYRLIERINCSVRIDIAQNMDFAPIYSLLEVPPIGQNFTADDFATNGFNGRFYRDYYLPVNLWQKLQIGNLIEFVSKFPSEWIHYLARVIQDEEKERFKKKTGFLKEKYAHLKEVYGMKESEILNYALKVSDKLRRRGFSGYAITRPVRIIGDAILEARKGGFDKEAISQYAINRVLTLSSREVAREIRRGEGKSLEEIKEEIHSDVKELTERMHDYLKERGFKRFILLLRYLTEAVLVEIKFS